MIILKKCLLFFGLILTLTACGSSNKEFLGLPIDSSQEDAVEFLEKLDLYEYDEHNQRIEIDEAEFLGYTGTINWVFKDSISAEQFISSSDSYIEDTYKLLADIYKEDNNIDHYEAIEKLERKKEFKELEKKSEEALDDIPSTINFNEERFLEASYDFENDFSESDMKKLLKKVKSDYGSPILELDEDEDFNNIYSDSNSILILECIDYSEDDEYSCSLTLGIKSNVLKDHIEEE